MALKVVSATPQPKLKVTTNPGGMQGSTYNPQPAGSGKIIQNATPPRPLQAAPLAKPLQGGNAHSIQPAATAAQIQAAANAARIAVEREIARQKEIARANKQGEVDTRLAANKYALKLKVTSAIDNRKIAIGRNYYPGKINVPKYVSEDPEYDKIKEDAKRQAMKLVDSLKSDPSTDKWSRFVDKVTFGADRRASGARKWAEEQANATADRQVKVYTDKLDKHNKLQAKLQADYEAKKLKLSAAELNALADEYNRQLSNSVNDLKRVEAYTVGTVEGYGLKAEEKLKSKPSAAAGFINRNVIQKAASNPLWKYTLGEGSRNIPSVVTAPSRVINWVGNINTKDREIYKYGGGTASRVQSKDNAWQASFNQRNFNIRPVVDKPFSWSEVKKELDRDVLAKQKFDRLKTDKEKEEYAKKYWEQHNRSLRNQNT
ncbi:MAG: hypothetical protein E6R04_10100, partial [Spirochaetes bacterium]